MSNTMIKSGFLALLEQVAKERHISVDQVVGSIEAAIEAALRRERPELFAEEGSEEEAEGRIRFEVKLDRTEGSARIFRIEDNGKPEDVTPAGFGRIASQTAKNVIFQKVREAEKETMIAEFEERVGQLVQGTVIRYDGRNAIVDLGRGQAVMPPEEQMHGEFYRPNLRLTVLVKHIEETERGRQIIVSRADENLIIKLFEREVPEMAAGSVQVKGIAREAGIRTKMAVFSDQMGVDPVGSCVGQRGVRVQEVIREVNNEKIDIIQYTDDARAYLAAALAPAEALQIDVNSKDQSAIVTAPDDQLSLAIGRGGQNVRLAAKLTNFQITVKSATGDTQAAVTGDEEHEIDQIEGLDAGVRQYLIDNRATTFEDINHKWTTLMENFEGDDDQRAKLEAARAEFQVRMAERDEQERNVFIEQN